MRVPVRAGLVLAAVALLAACGSVAAPIVSGPHVHPGGTRLVLASPGPPAGSRAEAVTLARRMLSRLRMPAGARRLPPPVPRPLREPDLWAGAAAALDLHQLFELRQPVGAVAAGLMAHVPAGMSLGSTGALVEPAGVASREVGYAARQVPAGVRGLPAQPAWRRGLGDAGAVRRRPDPRRRATAAAAGGRRRGGHRS